MSKFLSIISLSLMIAFGSSNVFANHCSGGHKEIKDTKETSSEDSKETSSK